MTVQLQAADNAVSVPVELQARKPTRIRLAPSTSGADMVSVIARENIADLRHNLQVFMITGSAASVHKSRVSARRLRVFLKATKTWVLPKTHRSLAMKLKLAMAVLHPLRQHDVVMERLDAAGVATRDMGYDRVAMAHDAQAQVSKTEMIDFVDEFARLMQVGGWRRRDTEVLDQPCLCIVPGIIEQSIQNLHRAGSLERVFETTGDYHAFRKDLKRLRYWLEFTRSLFAKKDMAPWRKTTKLLQGNLGTVNDLDEARMTGYDRLVAADAWGLRRSAAVDLAVSLSDTLYLLPRFWR